MRLGDKPKVTELLTERNQMEEQFRALLAKKSESTLDEYYAELKTLMLRFARLQRSLDQETGWVDAGE